ncbi:MAG TPA: glycogen synthase GlgA [Planctomycetota bacterium]|nr:glycogen synthase GlgA [Planctomycetota bacterium]
MKIAEITPEVAPFSKTGGLADVTGALPHHLAELGADVVVVSPLHRSVEAFELNRSNRRLKVPMGDKTVECGIATALIPGTHVTSVFIDHPDYFDREFLYGPPDGDYPDNAERFSFFARAALEFFKSGGEIPDIVHAHDWQSALAPVYLKTSLALAFPKTKSVLTIHNLAYQGLFPAADMETADLDPALFNWKQLEFFGKMGFLKGGIVFADALTTVSPTYAKEILTPEMGCGLDGVLQDRADKLHGILNGVDVREWSPENDRHLPATYSATHLKGKSSSKRELQRRSKLADRRDVPVFGFIGRLVEQKGVDLLCAAAERLMALDIQVVVLGSGDPRLSDMLTRLAATHPDKISVTLGFDNALAHLIEAGSDAFLMPSRFEPCGLNQIYSLRYGTIPIVRRTGGLADTIEDATPENLKKGKATGFVFDEPTPDALMEAVDRALALWKDNKAWGRIVQSAMKKDFTWGPSAKRYLDVFRSLR